MGTQTETLQTIHQRLVEAVETVEQELPDQVALLDRLRSARDETAYMLREEAASIVATKPQT